MIELVEICGAFPMAVVQKPTGEWVTLCHPASAEGDTPSSTMLIFDDSDLTQQPELG